MQILRMTLTHIFKIRTGIAIELPDGFEAQVRARSGLASRGFIVMNAPGTIDTEYRGEIIVLASLTSGFMTLERHERVAQLAIRAVPATNMELVAELSETERGADGFGSTGQQ